MSPVGNLKEVFSSSNIICGYSQAGEVTRLEGVAMPDFVSKMSPDLPTTNFAACKPKGNCKKRKKKKDKLQIKSLNAKTDILIFLSI